MKYGILKIGDTVKYTEEAKRVLPNNTNNRKYIVTVIDCGNQHAQGSDWTGADIYWLKRVRKAKKSRNNKHK